MPSQAGVNQQRLAMRMPAAKARAAKRSGARESHRIVLDGADVALGGKAFGDVAGRRPLRL
jgi:hypothetical protein